VAEILRQMTQGRLVGRPFFSTLSAVRLGV
jgi:hypothetical protein